MHCSCDHHYRQNPLKEKVWKERLKDLEDLGADPEKLKQIVENFNTEHNDSTHALYILDWYRARLSLERYAGTDQELQALSRYYSKYKLSDYHDLSLDGQLQIDYFDTFLHYAQLAHTQYVFRRTPWASVPPSTLIKQLQDREQSAEVKLYYRPKYHEPLISFPNGWSWVVMRPEDKESEADSLSDCASPEGDQSIIISLRQPFEAGYYQTRLRAQLTFPENIKVPLLHSYHEDRPEGVSYSDWQKSYPQRFREAITAELVKASPLLLVQLRSYHNHKPGTPLGMEESGDECYQCIKLSPGDRERIQFEDYLPYLANLLFQPWITWVLKPRYRPEGSFQLGELPSEVRSALYQKKPWMFNIRSFNHKYSVKAYGKHLEDVFFASPSQIIEELQTGHTKQFKRRLEAGVKYQRNRMFQALEDVLMRTKNKGAVKRLLTLLSELSNFKQTHRIAVKFFKERIDWLFRHFNYLTQTLEIVGKGNVPGAPWRESAINAETYRALREYILTSPPHRNNESAALILFKALFEVRISGTRWRAEEPTPLGRRKEKIFKRSHQYLSELLQIILDRLDYTPELQQWIVRRPLPFGNSEVRMFLNDWKATPDLLKQLIKLYSGTEVERYVAGKLVKSEHVQLRELATNGPITSRRLARKLIDSIYQNIYSPDDDLRHQTGSLLNDISHRRLLRRRTR